MDNLTTPFALVSRITLGRTVNLGNYQNERFDLTVDIPFGVDASKVFLNLRGIIDALAEKRPNSPEHLRYLESQANQSDEDWQYTGATWELSKSQAKERLRLAIESNNKWAAQKEEAIRAFNDLGGTYSFTDAKNTWGYSENED